MCAVIFCGWNRFILVGADRCCSRSDHAHVLATYFWSSTPTIDQPSVSHGSRERYLEPIATMNQALPKAQNPTKPVTTASIRMLETTHTENETNLNTFCWRNKAACKQSSRYHLRRSSDWQRLASFQFISKYCISITFVWREENYFPLQEHG